MAKLNQIDDDRRILAVKFIEQIETYDDPDALAEFLAWREDDRVASLLGILVNLSDDEIDQVLFFAEDQYSERQRAMSNGRGA